MAPPECHTPPTLACGLRATSPDGGMHTLDKHIKEKLSEAST